jgi:hypothetical protein
VSPALLLLLATSVARGAEPASTAADAQPGLHQVGIASNASPALAATFGYGYTEKQDAADGAHHRLSLRAAAALPVLRWLSLGALLDGRYDLHPHDSGQVLGGAVLARASAKTGGVRLGGELKAWVPGAEDASTVLRAASLDARALLGGQLGTVELASVVGFRFDRSVAAGTHASTLGAGDRLALGLSDFDAVLVGLGAGVPFGKSELLVEASADVLVGRGAPAFLQSPLRLAAGVRHDLTRPLALEVLAVGSLSAQPDLAPGAPLVPNEPRVSLFVGAHYRFLPSPSETSPREAPPPSPAPAPVPVPAPVIAAPTDARVVLVVRDEQGAPVPLAQASVLCAGKLVELASDGAGRYIGEHIAPGSAVLRVEALGFEPLERNVTLTAGVPLELELTLTLLPQPSQVRGLIRNLSGKPLVAKVRVEPIGLEAVTDVSGEFRLDLPPGNYDIAIEAPGYAKQKRRVSVVAQGVVVLNAELVKQR